VAAPAIIPKNANMLGLLHSIVFANTAPGFGTLDGVPRVNACDTVISCERMRAEGNTFIV
jgi:hypothetical protein